MKSKFTLRGKALQPGDLAEAMEDAVTDAVRRHLRERFSAIRHPRTGEFPTVVFLGNDLNDMSIRIEGSPELLDHVRASLTDDEKEMVELKAIETAGARKVFLSYAGEDAVLAEKIGRALMAKGIDTWWAGWSLAAGDSIRQKIDEGLSDCTHFVVLLTPRSIEKPWVKTEIDAAFVMKVEERCRFIPLRSGLKIGALTPLLATMRSPTVDDFDGAISQLVSDILGLTRKPALGAAPLVDQIQTGYSPAASAIAEHFVRLSPNAIWGDVQSTIPELTSELQLTEDDIRDAVFELRAHFKDTRFDDVIPDESFYAEFDGFFMPWKPADDALRVGADMLNDGSYPTDAEQIAARYGWEPRRLNSALAYLLERELIEDGREMGNGPWFMGWIERKHNAMRRFVKARM